MRQLTLTLALLIALTGCKKQTKSDETPTEPQPVPALGVQPHMRDAANWIAPDAQILFGVSTDPVWGFVEGGLPPERRTERYTAITQDLGRIFESKTGLDWTKLKAVVVGYSPTWSTILIYGDFSVDGLDTQRIEVMGEEAMSVQIDGELEGYAIRLDGGFPGYAVFEKLEDLEAAVRARREPGDDHPVLAEKATTEVRALLDELPSSNLMVSASLTGKLKEQVPAGMQGMMPREAAASLGTSTAVVFRGEPARIDALHDFVNSMIAEARAPVDQKYQGRGGLGVGEATGVVIAYHYLEAYLEALEVEKTEGTLAYRIELPPSRIGLALPGLAAAVAVPAFTRYTKSSKGSEAEVQLSVASQAILTHHVDTLLETGTGTFPGGPEVVVRCGQIPAGGEKLPVQPIAERGDVDPVAICEMLGLRVGEEMYFQYSYEAYPDADGGWAMVTAIADFDPGGPMHRALIEVRVDPETGEAYANPLVIQNELE